MAVCVTKFASLEKRLSARRGWRELIGPAAGAVRVVAIGRDGCPGCVKFKPVLEKLAKELAAGYGRRIKFARVHVSCPGGSMAESLRAKKLLGHYFYPTAAILARSKDLGVFEYYRAVSPPAGELRRRALSALRAAERLK